MIIGNIYLLDSDATTDDDTSERESATKKQLNSNTNKNSSKSDDESESGIDDVLTSRFRLPLPQHLIDEALKLSTEDSPVTASNKDTANEPLHMDNRRNKEIDSEAVADSVLSFFQSCGLNPKNLSDEQVEKYIEYIVKATMKPNNDRPGSVETITSSDSNQPWQYT